MTSFRQRRLLRRLKAGNEAKRYAAMSELARVGDEATFRRVERLLEGRGPEHGRAAAAYVLGFSGNEAVAEVLARRLADSDELPVVRAHAAEALGHLLQYRPVLAPIRAPIVAGLLDQEPDVRFWCAFAAGALELQESRPRLERLLSDDAYVEGWWTVGQEAEWALRCLDGEEHPPLPDRV
ncbi:MAG TPA: HEAT repeat domain-containing protein [Gaiellaceae bacterium]|nr:HEAT repeat domain-containing protein [Gaiellaceae bacterium]